MPKTTAEIASGLVAEKSICFVSFQFKDERVSGLQEINPWYLVRQVMQQPRSFESGGVLMSSGHKCNDTDSSVIMHLYGSSDAVTEEFGLEFTTASVLGWLGESGCIDISPSSVHIRLGRLGIEEFRDTVPKDVTEEAKAVELLLRQLGAEQPQGS